MDKPDMQMIDKLFHCLHQFFGIRWSKQFDRWYTIPMAKVIWQTALTGLSYDDIKRALVSLQQSARSDAAKAPSHMEFFTFARQLAKGATDAEITRVTQQRGDPAIARAALDSIKSSLRGKKINNGCST